MALEDTALALIRKFGEDRQVTVQIPAATPADPTKPWEVNEKSTTTDITVPAVVTPIRRSLVDGNIVQQGDETVLIAGLSLGTTVPPAGSAVVDEGTTKEVLDVQRIRPGKTDFLYKMQVRAP
jgi:hypothetical protein